MKHILFSASFLLILTSFSQTNSICFSEPTFQSAGSGPYDITSADFNNDGKADIAVANSGSNNLSVLINSGNGNFSTAINYSVGQNPWRIIALDLSNDGNLDLVTVNAGSGAPTYDISVLLGTGTGSFSAAVNYSVGPGPVSVASGDFNHDGKLDLAVSGILDTYFLFGLGNGAFNQAFTYGLGWEGMTSVSADINLDGFLDLAFIDASTGSNMSIFFGNALSAQTYYVGGVDCWSMLSGDYNNDGMADIAISNPDHVFLLFGGAFSSPVTYTLTVANAGGMTSSDINGDGNVDLIVANNGQDNVSILYGSSNGVFSLSTLDFWTGNGTMPGAVTSSDFNNDGKFDLATSNYFTNNVSILLNQVKPNVGISANSNSICIGSGISLQAYGASAYSWSTGDTTSINYQTPIITSTYTVIGTTINHCVNSQTILVTVDSTCQDVWPGDANSDGRADNNDILELGLHYAQAGSPRTTTSNTWQSYFANNWTGTITNGKNLNHSDCNGDGMIDSKDTLAIYNNYGLSHAFKPVQTTTVSPQLSIVPDQTAVVKGTWGTASIYLGDAANNITSINGLAFTIDFDNTLIETNNIYVEYQNSFLDAGQNLDFRKLNFANGKIYTANTHTISNNVSGFGKIATLHYQIKSSLGTDEILNLGLLQANQSNSSGAIIPLTSGTGTLMAMGSSVDLQELNGNVISMSPNPTNGSLTINSKHKLEKIEVISIAGQILLIEVPTSITHTLHLESLANGIYFVNLYQNDRIVKREKIVLSK